MDRIVNQIIKNGIANLENFGYNNVNEENIFTDEIYSAFFKSMLKDNLGNGFDAEINEILSKFPK